MQGYVVNQEIQLYHSNIMIWSTALTCTLVGAAMITDLRWRRIPNYLTFPALFIALVVHTILLGWGGLGLAILGAIVTPLLLMVFHGGRGLGLGDLKLAMALGAIAGPIPGATMMFVAAIIGGIQAIVIMLRYANPLTRFFSVILIGLPFKKHSNNIEIKTVKESPKTHTMPYGVAIGAGSLLTLAVSWWTGQEDWFLSFVRIVVNQ